MSVSELTSQPNQRTNQQANGTWCRWQWMWMRAQRKCKENRLDKLPFILGLLWSKSNNHEMVEANERKRQLNWTDSLGSTLNTQRHDGAVNERTLEPKYTFTPPLWQTPVSNASLVLSHSSKATGTVIPLDTKCTIKRETISTRKHSENIVTGRHCQLQI